MTDAYALFALIPVSEGWYGSLYVGLAVGFWVGFLVGDGVGTAVGLLEYANLTIVAAIRKICKIFMMLKAHKDQMVICW